MVICLGHKNDLYFELLYPIIPIKTRMKEKEEQEEEFEKQHEIEFDDEDSIEALIERSRKRGNKGKRYKEEENKGLFDKLFRK